MSAISDSERLSVSTVILSNIISEWSSDVDI